MDNGGSVFLFVYVLTVTWELYDDRWDKNTEFLTFHLSCGDVNDIFEAHE